MKDNIEREVRRFIILVSNIKYIYIYISEKKKKTKVMMKHEYGPPNKIGYQKIVVWTELLLFSKNDVCMGLDFLLPTLNE